MFTAPLLTASFILELARQNSQHFYFPLALPQLSVPGG
jgi:hypothetical protein